MTYVIYLSIIGELNMLTRQTQLETAIELVKLELAYAEEQKDEEKVTHCKLCLTEFTKEMNNG